MGVYSTLAVSREEALAAYNRLILPRQPSDSQLEAFLDDYLSESLLNVRIASVPDEEDEDMLRRYTQG
jgi:hypothetical protein